MEPAEILWSQKANSRGNTITHFLFFLYEFVGARFTILAFIGLFSFATYRLEYFGHLFSAAITLFLFYIVSDAFNVFWNGINLRYTVTNDMIVFNWGVFRPHELKVPFSKITIISTLAGGKTKSIIFDNKDEIKNGDFGISKEIYFNRLSFENINDIQGLIDVLEHQCHQEVVLVPSMKPYDRADLIPSTTLYHKLIQALVIVLLYAFSYIALHIIDTAYMTKIYVQDTVISQETYVKQTSKMLLRTEQGYSMVLNTGRDYVGDQVEFYVSPWFKVVTKFQSYSEYSSEKLLNPYSDIPFIFKFLTCLILLFCSCYIMYHRGQVPIADLLFLGVFPAVLLFLNYVVVL